MDLALQLKEDGIAKGLCRPWQGKLREGLPLKDLVGLYFRGIDFCISNDYPTLDFLRKEVKGKCEAYGVFVDDEVRGLRNFANISLNGACKAILEYDGFSVSRLYIRNTSEAGVCVSGHAFLTVDIFDDARLTIGTAGDDVVANVNVYGNACVEAVGSGIKLKYRNKKTY